MIDTASKMTDGFVQNNKRYAQKRLNTRYCIHYHYSHVFDTYRLKFGHKPFNSSLCLKINIVSL